MSGWSNVLVLMLACAVGCSVDPISVDDPLPLLWSQDFSGGGDSGTEGLTSEWTMIFGELIPDAGSESLVAHPSPEDGDDDYGYRRHSASNLTISADVHWDDRDAVGVELICSVGAVNESLYELALYQSRLQLLRYDGGGDPTVYEVLATSPPLELGSGEYTLTLRARYNGLWWVLFGQVSQRGSAQSLASVDTSWDFKHGSSIGQGIGIYNRSNQNSRVFSIRVYGTP